jgi:hypothetical protein
LFWWCELLSLYFNFLVPASIVLYSSRLLRANLEQVSFNIFCLLKKNGTSLEEKKKSNHHFEFSTHIFTMILGVYIIS